MTNELEIQSALNTSEDRGHPTLIPAVCRCCLAYNTRLKVVLASGEQKGTARDEARHAYRETMPALSGAQNIRDFIACLGHGMTTEVIDAADGARLLHAAQTAYRMCPVKNPPPPTTGF